ncbi:M16 family metallopeptidase [Aestuariibaculum marinum]|uniref:Insulinase family protein n=1 Tax=Aestuariibaculum marinum TaxID=2683592 RepID=A0A8J6PUY5_9FLAO|nr:M16 family metallopeptidase [Aestuariibaculum marinum]MBD0824240.1 insulinase family protein [Aestuariibaculum marinum]
MNKGILNFLSIILISAHSYGQKFFMPEGITYKKLENGFRYYIVPNGEPGKIGIYLLSDTGSFVEKQEERGVAHFLEHMVFKGSKNYPGNETSEALERMGLRIGRDYNGSVNDTHTEYRVFIPENNKETLKQTLRLMNDWCFNLQMDSTDLEVEKKVVIEEIKLRRGGGTPFVIGTYLEGHNGLGSKEQINSVTSKDVKDFYHKYYTADQLALVIYGKVDEKKVSRYIHKLYGKLPRATDKTDNKYLDLSRETIVNGNYQNENSEMLVLGFKTRDFPVVDLPSYKKDLIYKVFCEMLENRINQLSNSDLERVRANIAVPFTGNLWFNFRLEAKKDASYNNMLKNFNYVIAQARRFGFLQEEINFFVNKLLKRYTSALGSADNYFGAAQLHFFKGEMPISTQDKVKYTQEIANTITPRDFIEVLNSFTDLNKTILFDKHANAFQAGFNEAYILGAIKQIDKNTKVAPYQFSEPSNQFEIRNNTNLPEVRIENLNPKSIKKKVKLGDYLYLLEYDNGIKVVVNNAPNSQTQIKIVSKHGLNNIPEKDRALFKFTADYLDEAFGDYNQEEARDLRRKLRVYKNLELGNTDYELQLKGSNQNFQQLIKVFNLIVNNQPQLKVDEVQKRIDRFYKSPNNSNDTYQGYTNKILGKGLDTPSIEKPIIDENIIGRFLEYNQWFKRSLKDAYIYVGGELPEDVDELISTYIATIQPVVFNTKIDETQPPLKTEKPAIKDISWNKKSTKSSFMFASVSSKPITFKDQLISEGIAEYGYKRMFQILRKKYGYVYSLGASSHTNVSKNLSALSIRYIVEDEANVEAAQKAMIDEVLYPMSQGELSDDDTTIIKALLEKDYVASFYETDRVSSDYLRWGLDYGKLYTMKDFQKMVRKISKEDIERYMKRLINLEAYFILVQK